MGIGIPANKTQVPQLPPGTVGATSQPTAPQEGQQNMFALIASLLGGQQQQQPGLNLGALLTQMRNEPQGDANKGYVPGAMPGDANAQHNPFANGFFQSQNQRIGNESAQLGQYGITGVQAGLAPIQHNPNQPSMGQPVQEAPPNFGGGFNPTTRGIPGGFEGMINPNLPDAQKFADPNFFTAKPGFSTLPPGAVAGDGTTSYRRPGAPPFSFGAGLFGPPKPKTLPQPQNPGGFNY